MTLDSVQNATPRANVSGQSSVPFTKGHGTGNDFVIIDSLDSGWNATAAQVAALCDRRMGIGADGLLRVVTEDGRFFMDYRNADGSIAETCGNGLRVFCTYLHSQGLLAAGRHEIGTRGGVVIADITADGAVSVDMGPAKLMSGACTVEVLNHAGTASTLGAIAVAMPNPHCVAMVDDLAEAGPLSTKPTVDVALFPDDANVEFVRWVADAHIAMRVWERGVGETLSCGSGACAAAFAAATAAGLQGEWTLTVDVPGGQLTVSFDQRGHLHLAGPAVLVATGHVDMSNLTAASA